MLKVLSFCVWLGVALSSNIPVEESIEGRVSKMEVELHGLTLKVDSLGNGLESIGKSVAKIMEHLKIRPQNDRRDGRLSEEKDKNMNSNDVTTFVNDTNLEERVTVLEFQMAIVQEDIDIITNDVTELDASLTDLDEDVEAQITIILADISTLQSDQSVQDNRLLIIESDVEGFESDVVAIGEELIRLEETDQRLNSSLIVLESRVAALEELNSTVEELTENLEQSISELEETDTELTSSILDAHADIEATNERLLKLEVNGTVAFHVFLHEYTSIPIDSTVIFDQVYTNLRNAYNVTTGLFTVPPGGGGLYYFYVHFVYASSEFARFNIYVNGQNRCATTESNLNSGDYASSSCSATAILQEGMGILNQSILLE